MANTDIIVIGTENKDLIKEVSYKFGLKVSFFETYSRDMQGSVILVSTGSRPKDVVLKGIEFCTYSDSFSEDDCDYVKTDDGTCYKIADVKLVIGNTMYLKNGDSVNSSSFIIISQRRGKIEPVLELGLKTSGRRIVVDEYMKTSVQNVFAVGSVCSMFGKMSGKQMIERAFASIEKDAL